MELNFFVEKQKIYYLESDVKKNKEMDLKDMQLVYQKEDLKRGGETNYSISYSKDRTEFVLYNDKVETGYYKRIEWGKNRNIISYETGYGAGKDIFKIKFQ